MIIVRLQVTVFENQTKSLILQYFERSELHLFSKLNHFYPNKIFLEFELLYLWELGFNL